MYVDVHSYSIFLKVFDTNAVLKCKVFVLIVKKSNGIFSMHIIFNIC